jgi:hypothetical protein
MREGKIRGQPKARRTPPMGGYPSFLQPPDMALPGVAGPGPSSGRGREMPNEFDLGAMFGFNDPMMAHSPFGGLLITLTAYSQMLTDVSLQPLHMIHHSSLVLSPVT